MTKSEEEARKADFSRGFHDLPNERELERISIIDLAALLVDAEKDSVKHIVLSHELTLKIVRKQAQLSHRGIWIVAAGTLVGTILGAAITAFFC